MLKRDIASGIPATTIGMLYLLILTFFFTAAFNGTRQPLEKKLKVGHLIAIRILVPALAYAFISLSVSLMALAFGVQFSNYYGKGGFVLFWLYVLPSGLLALFASHLLESMLTQRK